MGDCLSKVHSNKLQQEQATTLSCCESDSSSSSTSTRPPDDLQAIDALLKHLSDVHVASFSDISSLKENLFSSGWLHLSSRNMVAALKFFGATTEDLCRVADPASSPHGKLYFNEPALPWKKTQASRFILRKVDKDSAFEGCDSKSVVRYEVNKKQVDFGEYWKDANSQVRSWEPLPEWYGSEQNSVYMAYQKLSHYLIDPSMDPAPGSMPGSDMHVSDHFCIRITKTPKDSEIAQPSPEGVHHDGSDIIMITLMNRRNVDPKTGQSRVWHSDQPSGPYPEESFNDMKHRCHGNFVMMQPYETILAIDSRVKHEARAIKPKLKDMPCSRDVTVHWTRSPRLSGCDTLGKDSKAKEWLPRGQKVFKFDNASNSTLNFWAALI